MCQALLQAWLLWLEVMLYVQSKCILRGMSPYWRNMCTVGWAFLGLGGPCLMQGRVLYTAHAYGLLPLQTMLVLYPNAPVLPCHRVLCVRMALGKMNASILSLRPESCMLGPLDAPECQSHFPSPE